jgi:membrane fusion protein, multidrug efflux system
MDQSNPVNEAEMHARPPHSGGHLPPASSRPSPRRSWHVPVAILGATAAVLAGGGLLFFRAASATNHVALASRPKGVTVVEARASSFRGSRRYVATIEPWLRANIGPQLVSGYVDTVLVRPGAVVKRGDVLATLDCRNTSAASSQVAMLARSMEAKQTALAKEATRVSGLLKGGFVSANEVEQKDAETASMQAQLLGMKAKLQSASLEVNDCVLRAPFDGEVASRMIDPGAFVRPGQAIITLVDRGTVRVSADVPEGDFAIVAPGMQARMRMLATATETTGSITRRAPAADASTRTIHFEIDLADPERRFPVGTSSEVRVDVGEPAPATVIPLAAALIRGSKASLFVITGAHAHATTVAVKGEDGGRVFLDAAALPPGSQVVLEGRALLNDGDAVEAKLAAVDEPSASGMPATEKDKPSSVPAKGAP